MAGKSTASRGSLYPLRNAVLFTGAYLVLSFFYFWLSGAFAARLARSVGELRRLELVEELGFVVLTSLLLFAFSWKYLGHIADDIAECQRIEEHLRQREELFELEFENAPLAIVTCDLKGRVSSANRAACHLLGFANGELAGLRLTDLTHPDDRPRSLEMIARLARGEVTRYTEKRRYLRRDGSVAHGMLHAAVVHGTEGESRMLVVQVEDHTARLEAEQEADQLRERLAHVGRLSTLGEMAAGIAHEINQPLTAITIYARACQRMIRAGKTAEPQLVEALDKVSAQAKRAGEVIRRLRSLIRKHDSHRESVDVNELVSDVVQLAETESRLRGVGLRVELEEPSVAVVADGVQIQQVVLNLLRNGMEAMEGSEGAGDLVLRTAVRRESEVEVAVTDRGTGVSEELEEQLFHPFVTTKDSGMGIGLSICRSIVESHGGKLWFTRNLDGGTTFRFTLPTAIGAAHD